MAKQVVILRVDRGSGGDNNVNYLFWLAVATGREIPISGAVSAWTGASTAENTAIAAGQVIEEQYSTQYPTSMTKAQIEADLLSKFSARQSAITAKPNPNQFYGTFYDPSAGGWN